MTEVTKIQKGDVVRYVGSDQGLKDRWFRITRVTKKTVNLGAIYGGTIYAKGVQISEVKEDGDAFYKKWMQSDTYRQM